MSRFDGTDKEAILETDYYANRLLYSNGTAGWPRLAQTHPTPFLYWLFERGRTRVSGEI